MTELKPCPFCGARNIKYLFRQADNHWTIRCNKCGVKTRWKQYKDDCAKMWNRRAQDGN